MGVRFCNNCCAIGRRLAEATKACRTRRTWGEMVLRFFLFLAPAEAAVFFLTDGLLVEAGLDVALFDVVLWAGALAAGDGASSVSAGDLDWATAGGTKASQTEGENCNEKIPAKTRTAKRRTQTLPTAESWHP